MKMNGLLLCIYGMFTSFSHYKIKQLVTEMTLIPLRHKGDFVTGIIYLKRHECLCLGHNITLYIYIYKALKTKTDKWRSCWLLKNFKLIEGKALKSILHGSS